MCLSFLKGAGACVFVFLPSQYISHFPQPGGSPTQLAGGAVRQLVGLTCICKDGQALVDAHGRCSLMEVSADAMMHKASPWPPLQAHHHRPRWFPS